MGWALSDPASAAKVRRATGYLLTSNLSVKWWAVAYPRSALAALAAPNR